MKEKVVPTFVETKNTENIHDALPAEICEEFLQETGMHGVNKLKKSSRNCWRRVLWGCAILGCGIYLIITVTKEIQKYLTYPRTTSIDIDIVQELDFPAVTICNLSPFNKSKIIPDDKLLNYDASMNALGWFASNINWSDPYYRQNDFYEPISMDHLMTNLSMELTKMFIRCSFDNIGNCTFLFKQIYTSVGPCFVFNQDGSFKTSRKGGSYNLYVDGFIDQINYYYSFTVGSGFKVFVHEPGDMPDVRNEGLVVPPGTIAYIAIKKQKYEFLPPPFKAFNDGYCLDLEASTQRDPMKYTNYTVNRCLENCFRKMAESRMNCTPIVYSDTTDHYCSQYEMKTLIVQFYSIFIDKEVDEKCKLQCPIECKYTKYSTQISYGQYPSDFISDELLRYVKWNKTTEYIRNNYLNVRVYYDRLATKITRQVPVYSSWEQILANLGGQMGLFLGASIITLTELLEFFVQLTLHIVRRSISLKGGKTNKF